MKEYMENNFYNLFKKIIRECNYDNTYKMAWAKALVEISIENVSTDRLVCIKLEEMAKKYIKYYWNQTIFFDLIQGSNLIKTPIVLQHIKVLIENYYKHKKVRKPIRFEKIEDFIKDKMLDEYDLCLKNIVRILKRDVSWRFTFIDGKKQEEIYKYAKGSEGLYILKDNMEILKENANDLFDLINYRWGVILETFNNCPRINRKVKIIDEQEIKRASLSKFKKYLDIENKEKKCFICEEKISDKELSIDHVIPWSYLYSDDLWNLVYVHKTCNARKNNVIPNEEKINKLKVRNEKLLKKLKEKNVKGKEVDELNLAIEKQYVDKFWLGCRS